MVYLGGVLQGSRRGAEPMNNAVERAQRPAVVWHKKSYGSAIEAGRRYAESLLSVVTTLRLRARTVIAYLTDALIAYRQGLPTPSVLIAQ